MVGFSQLNGVEYNPSRGGTSVGGSVSIFDNCSPKFMDEKFSSSERALSRALSSKKSSSSLGAGSGMAVWILGAGAGVIALQMLAVSHATGCISGRLEDTCSLHSLSPFRTTHRFSEASLRFDVESEVEACADSEISARLSSTSSNCIQ